jgi:uncharacterized ferritin-like protein (DUF455 family)
MVAYALRERVFELRYPSRMLEIGQDAPLVELFDQAINAPSDAAFVLSLARLFKPALLAAYRDYLAQADELSDGPILRALHMAVEEKTDQIAALNQMAENMVKSSPERQQEAEAWVAALSDRLDQVGGLSLEEPQAPDQPLDLAGQREFRLAEVPARDPRFFRCRYYWPDVISSNFSYGEGILLQLRSAVSHLNEVWAVETGGAILYAFAEKLDWDFIHDAARWTYDESRHAMMGYERLRTWGFEPEEMPLGSYIYDSARGQDPAIRLGMLHYFETKNIGKKTKRANAFASYEDKMSQHDMDFDWADETIHAYYGKRWLNALHEAYPDQVPDIETLRDRCDWLVAQEVAGATEADRAATFEVAEAMIAKAKQIGLSQA